MFDRDNKTYHFTLPMPPTLNKAYIRLKNDRVVRSDVYNQWAQIDASASFRRQYRDGTPCILTGRIQAYYMFFFTEEMSDTGNREKCLSDFLQGKFIRNDNQIDKTVLEKRINLNLARGYVRIWLTEIQDGRWEKDPFGAGGI